ncbi:T9SS type A sorting domain-containing protein [Saprospiraceae bacterium]|jgi:hypothetical protein|nr:T9SS type A sorting domain-containing protein [Bacteroidota bacterium]MDB4727270.1 T9SS type A sorting domain-containing protein [Saprospiraceae bacterium]
MNQYFTPNNNIRFMRFLIIAFAFLFSNFVYGQSCNYSLEMYDSWGDGWNGGSTVTITVGGISNDFTLATGLEETVSFPVNEGDNITVEYAPGSIEFEVSYAIFDADGIQIFADGQPPQTGLVFSTTGTCPICPRVSPNDVSLLSTTDITASMSWPVSSGAQNYIIEYGPAGFPLGWGNTDETTSSFITIGGLNPCVEYEAYIYSVCGIDSLSTPSGPIAFTTTWSENPVSGPCDYTVNMFSQNGFGWGSASLAVDVAGNSTQFDFFFGNQQTLTIPANGGDLITIGFNSGFDDGNVSYEIVDNNGNIVFSDGDFPQIGSVFQVVACATCNIPGKFRMYDINADNAKVTWDLTPNPTGEFEVEYGPLGFTKGTGTIVSLEMDETEAQLVNLMENAYYDVYIQTVCDTSNRSKPIGPITFQTLFFNDVGVVGVNNPSDDKCVYETDEKVEILIRNFGQKPQTLFNFRYAVNGEPIAIPIPMDGFYTGVIGNDSIQYIEFETEYDFSIPGYYFIEAWTELEEDSDVANDTFAFEIITAYPKPLEEDFETGIYPETWTSSNGGFIYAPGEHNNPTSIIGGNLYSGVQTWENTTPNIGLINADDVLSFDYRFVDWFAGIDPTILSGTDRLEVQISTDCGDTFETVYTIDSTNHIVSSDFVTAEVPLTDYEGQAISIRFKANWGSINGGDYWCDLDNINIPGCPENFGLFANSTVANEVSGELNGSIDAVPLFGVGPFTYLWNTGAQTQSITNLPAGLYSLTITDANGCIDEEIFEVNSIVGTEELVEINEMKLFPNPTSGMANLEVSLSKSSDLTIQVFNSNGIQVLEKEAANISETLLEIDLNNQVTGMYFVRILTEHQSFIERLMISK